MVEKANGILSIKIIIKNKKQRLLGNEKFKGKFLVSKSTFGECNCVSVLPSPARAG